MGFVMGQIKDFDVLR